MVLTELETTMTPNWVRRKIHFVKQYVVFSFFVFTFTLISINTQDLQNVNPRQTVFNLIKRQIHDVIFL